MDKDNVEHRSILVTANAFKLESVAHSIPVKKQKNYFVPDAKETCLKHQPDLASRFKGLFLTAKTPSAKSVRSRLSRIFISRLQRKPTCRPRSVLKYSK